MKPYNKNNSTNVCNLLAAKIFDSRGESRYTHVGNTVQCTSVPALKKTLNKDSIYYVTPTILTSQGGGVLGGE